MFRRIALALALLVSTALLAQEHPNTSRGFGSQKSFDLNEVDQINNFNGNLLVQIPLGLEYPVGGNLSYSVAARYSGNNWRYEKTYYGGSEPYVDAVPNGDWNAGYGWLVSFGRIAIPPGWDTLAYQSPDGHWHALYDTLHQYDAQDAGDTGMRWAYTRDGTYLRVKMVPGELWEVQFPDGAVHKFYSNGQIYQMTDRFGNTVTIDVIDPYTTYETHPNTEWRWNTSWRIRDQHGRTHYVHFRPNQYGGEMVGKVEVAAFNGARATYRFNYTYAWVSHPCTVNPDPNKPITTAMPLLTSVDLPDGSSYSMMEYDTGDGVSCSNPYYGSYTGSLKSLRLPTLGKIEWSYRDYQFPGDPEVHLYHTFHSSGVGERRLRAAGGTVVERRTYDPQMTAGTGLYPPHQLANTVTWYRSDGVTVNHRVKHYFAVDNNQAAARGWYGLPLSRVERAAGTNIAPNPDGASVPRYISSETFDASGTLVRATYVRAEGDDDLNAYGEVNQRTTSQRTVFYDDNTGCSGARCWTATDYALFDGLGNFRQVQAYSNFRSSDSSLDLRTTFTNYNPARGTFYPTSYPSTFTMLPVSSPWVLNTYPERSVTEGSATQKQQFCFEASTGFLLRHRRLAGGTPAANDLLTVYTRDTGGNLIREEFYGGDVQALGTGDLCSLTLPSNQYRIDHTYQYGMRKTSTPYDAAGAAMSFKTLDYDIDLSTGLVTAVRDSAGLSTTWEYDVMGRPIWTAQILGEWTQYVYTRATTASSLATIETKRWANSMSALLAHSKEQLDAFGRTWRGSRLMPNGTWSVRETLYNGMGWIDSVSEMQTTPSNRTYFQNYDPFGRARTITPPDGTAHNVTIAYAGERATTTTKKVGTSRDGAGNIIETDSVKTEIRDGHGRLWKVIEQSGAAGANVTTTYDYGIADRMKSAVTSAAEGTQTRTFTWDGRGLLVSDQIPEKTAATTYTNYDARGFLRRKSNAAAGVWDMLYTYDRAGRLTLVQSSRNSVVKNLTEYSYASANGTVDGVTDYRNGKLAEAKRHNWLSAINASTGVVITEAYFYGGRQGRVSKRTTTSSTGASFTQSFTVNDLGDRATTTYPTCGHTCGNTPARTISFGYANGFLNSVPSYATSISYSANGVVTQVAHANGVTWNQTLASNGMARPASISTTGAINASGAAADWNSGAYVYDGASNIVKVGGNHYLYDKVSRLIEGTADDNAGATRKQSYGFDSFGNVTSFTTNGTTRSIGVSSATNRLSSQSYDANGNVTTYLSDTYVWDDLDMLSSLSPSSRGWHYIYTADNERVAKYNHLTGNVLWSIRDLNGAVLRDFTHVNWRVDGSLGAGTWNWYRDYVYRGDALLASIDASETRHLHADHLGTPRLITSPTRVVRSRHDYYPFGQEASSVLQNFPSAEERMKFTGHERDLNGSSTAENTDYIDYMHARYYDPMGGRFFSLDPAAPDPSSPQSWNRYLYVEGNPLRFSDPTGMLKDCEECPKRVGENPSSCASAGGAWSDYGCLFYGTTATASWNPWSFGNPLFGSSAEFGGGGWSIWDPAGNGWWLGGSPSSGGSFWGEFGEFMAPDSKADVVLSVLGGPLGKLGKVAKRAGFVDELAEWLGDGAQVKTNKFGDKVFVSSDGTRRIRFDINHPHPHQSPHAHMEWLENGKWKGTGQVYPAGVPKH